MINRPINYRIFIYLMPLLLFTDCSVLKWVEIIHYRDSLYILKKKGAMTPWYYLDALPWMR